MVEKVKRKPVSQPASIFRRLWHQLRLTWALLLDNRISILLKLIPIAAVAFLLSPFDLVLNMIPVLGQIDDVAVILIAVALFNTSAPPDIVKEHLTRIREGDQYRIRHDKDGTIIDVKSARVEEPQEDQREADDL